MATNRVGIRTEIRDQNLLTKPVIPENISIVIDRAFSGPTNTLYLAKDFKIATALYGEQSPIIQLAKDVLAGSSNNAVVALYRIGGGAGILKNIFGEFTSIQTSSETVGAGQDLSVYVGPRPNDASKFCLIVTKAGTVVYSNVPGSIVDKREVIVDGFDEDYVPFRVGTLQAPVALNTVAENLLNSIVDVKVASVGTSLDEFELNTPVLDVSSNLVVSKTTGTITTNITAFTKTVTGGLLEGITLTTPVADGDVITLSYTSPLTPTELQDSGVEFELGKNSLSANLNTLYELYDSAFEDLENVKASTVTIRDLFNCRNIAAGDDDSADRLTYVSRTETEDGYEYEWSVNKFLYEPATPGALTTNPLLAALDDNGQPIIAKVYNEVDFAHRLGTWAWVNSTTSDYIHGTIGVVLPKAVTTSAIKRWIGTLPVTDIYGTIVENGTGLLGNRFMAGTVDRIGGFYATDTGYPDGSILKDSFGTIIDLGKYLSIATIPCYLSSDLLSGRTAPLAGPRSFSAAYAGLITQVSPGDSTTNQAFNQVAPLFTIKDSVASTLSSLGYVALVSKAKGVVVFSGDLATSVNSDFDYISTALAVSYVLKRLEEVIDPYLGRGLDLPLAAALNNSVDVALKTAAGLGIINGYAFVISRVGANNLAIDLKITAKEELRVVDITLALSPDTTFNLEG